MRPKAPSSYTLDLAVGVAEGILSSAKLRGRQSSAREALKLAAREKAPGQTSVDALAEYFLDPMSQKLLVEKQRLNRPSIAQETFAILTVHFAERGDEQETLRAAFWLQTFTVAHRDVTAILRKRWQARNAARRPRTPRKVSDDQIRVEVGRLKSSGKSPRNWVAAIGDRLTVAGITISDEALRKRLRKLYPKKSGT